MKPHMKSTDETVEVASGGTTSESFQIPGWAMFIGALLPSMDDGPISINISEDDSTFHPVLDPADGQDLVVVASGSDPGWIDLSDFLRFIPEKLYVRFGCAAQSSGAVDIKVFFRG